MLVGTYNQENALVGAFFVIVKLRVIFAEVRLQLYWWHTAVGSRGLVRVRGRGSDVCCVVSSTVWSDGELETCDKGVIICYMLHELL